MNWSTILAVVRFLEDGIKIKIMMTPIKAVIKTMKGKIFYGRFNADEYDERRNDVVRNTFCSTRCLFSNSNISSD